MNKVSEIEKTIRLIDELLPTMATNDLERWQSIVTSLKVKIDKELTNTSIHTCRLCLFQEAGYRNELPPSWYIKGDSEICFQHEYKDAERGLKAIGEPVDAFFPPETSEPSRNALRATMDNLPSTEVNAFDELLGIDI